MHEIERSYRLPPEVQKRVDQALLDIEGYSALPEWDDVRDPRAAQFHRHARAETTRKKYRYFLGIYFDWLRRTKRDGKRATSVTLEAFATFLGYEWEVRSGKNKGAIGMSPNSIRLATAAVRTYHRVQGDAVPDSGLAAGVVGGHERSRADDPRFSDGQGAPGLRLPTLRQMFEVCDPDTIDGARDMALLSMGWATMGRRAELSRIQVSHVQRDPNGLKIYIAKSKTDQLARGRTILVPLKPELGILCPVTNVLRWNGVLADHGIVADGFFRGIDKHGHINGLPGWAGRWPSVYMDPTTVERVIARRAVKALVPDWEKYTAHSLRRGGATDLYQAGVDILAIARQGGWGERSPVVFRYIEDAQDWKRNALTLANFGQG